ncbi:MAG: MATE family efflux transporter [Candidatus Heteroscillospira sp.]
MSENRDFLEKEPMGPLLLRLALPSVVAQLVNLLYNAVDSVYIGHIPGAGRLALTGVGVCMPVVIAMSAFSALVGRGGAPKMSICMGQKNDEAAERILGSCFAMLLLVGVVLTAAFLPFAEPLLWLFGASEGTIGYALDYVRIYACGTMFVMISLGLNAFITAQGYTKMSMLTVVIGAALNIVLDPIFIFALDMGVEGAALATIISQAVSAVWAVRFLATKARLRIRRKYMRLDFKLLGGCLALGISPFVMQITESLIAICFNRSLLLYGGELAVGAMTVFLKLMQFITMPMQGIVQGAQPITSYNFGCGNADRVRKSVTTLITVCLIYSLTACGAIMLFPRAFISLFNDEAILLDYAVKPMRVYFAGMGIFGAQIACQNSFLSMGNARASVFLALLRKVILLAPLIYILPQFMADKTMAVFLAEPVADFIAVFTTVTMFAISFRKTLREMRKAS